MLLLKQRTVETNHVSSIDEFYLHHWLQLICKDADLSQILGTFLSGWPNTTPASPQAFFVGWNDLSVWFEVLESLFQKHRELRCWIKFTTIDDLKKVAFQITLQSWPLHWQLVHLLAICFFTTNIPIKQSYFCPERTKENSRVSDRFDLFHAY